MLNAARYFTTFTLQSQRIHILSAVACSRDIDQSDLICDLEARSIRPGKVGDTLCSISSMLRVVDFVACESLFF